MALAAVRAARRRAEGLEISRADINGVVHAGADGRSGLVLFDTVPGGAGSAARIAARPRRRGCRRAAPGRVVRLRPGDVLLRLPAHPGQRAPPRGPQSRGAALTVLAALAGLRPDGAHSMHIARNRPVLPVAVGIIDRMTTGSQDHVRQDAASAVGEAAGGGAFGIDAFTLDDRLRLFHFAAAEKRHEYLWVLRAFDRARANYQVLMHVSDAQAALDAAGG